MELIVYLVKRRTYFIINSVYKQRKVKENDGELY